MNKTSCKSSNSVCAICCLSFPKSQIQSDFRYLFHFQKLSAQLSPSTAQNNNGQAGNKSNKSTKKSSNKSSTLAFICPGCLFSVSSALDKKGQVIFLEEQVREVQVQILKLLRSLQGTINSFKSDVNKVETLISESSAKVKNLDEFFGDGREEDKVKSSSSALKDAIQFRENILTVLKDLRDFSQGLIINVSSVDDSPPPPITSNHKPTPSGLRSEDNDDGDQGHVSSDEEYVDEKDADDLPGNDEVPSEDDDDLDSGPSVEEAHPSQDFSDDDNPSDDGDEEFVPSSSKAAKKKVEIVKFKSLHSTMDYTGMTPFKKEFLRRIIIKSEKLSGKRKPRKKRPNAGSIDDIDPLKKHWLTYDPATDAITLAGFKLVLNDQEESLECSDCGFKSHHKSSVNPVERSMYNHILGHHLKLSSCPHCQTVLTSYHRFRQHVLGHRNQYACDICGKPLKGSTILTRHKWLHMNEAEKAEAMKSGENPIEKDKEWRKGLEKKFLCSTCGKGFSIQAELRIHEKIHMERENYMCSQCGKILKCKTSLRTHQKFVCVPGKGQVPTGSEYRFHCDQCHRKFPYENKLKAHKLDFHAENPSPSQFKCSVCDKLFKLKALLRTHEKTHSDARPYSCRNGCGATYKNTTHRLRHEKCCKAKQV